MLGTMQDVPLSVARILEHGSLRHPRARVATMDSDGGFRTSTFAEIGTRAAAVAHALSSLGVSAGTVVASVADNVPEHLELLFAVPSMGAVIHPANPLSDPSDLAESLRASRARVVCASPEGLGTLATILPMLDNITDVIVFGTDLPPHELHTHIDVHVLEELLDGCPTTYPWPRLDEQTAAAIAFTSGTTGPPRGVVYSHRSIWLHSMQTCMAESFGLSNADDVLLTIPVFHVLAWGVPFAAFMTGASLVLPTSRIGGPHPRSEATARALRTLRPNKAVLTPTVAIELLQYLDGRSQDIGHLDEIIVGGSAMPPAVWDAYWSRHRIGLIQAWGMTEMSPLGTVSRPDPRASATRRRRQILGHGRFPAAVEARLVDADGFVSEDGTSLGEVEVRGPWVTNSYLGDPPEERGKFNDGWMRTGDVGTLSSDGYLTLTDRVEDVIHSGGEWISSVQLENAVMRDPRVAEAACIGVPDPKWGSRPLAVVVLKEGVEAGAVSLWNALDGTVDAWMRPDHWTFVDSIPLTAVGKYDKRAIRTGAAVGEYDITTVGP